MSIPSIPDNEHKIRAIVSSAEEVGHPTSGLLRPEQARNRASNQADVLVELAQNAEFFHTSQSDCFADVYIEGHRETWPIRGLGFRRWLTHRFFEATGGAPSSNAMLSALNVIEAAAHYRAPGRAVYLRVGEFQERQYLDLGDDAWRAIEIDTTGWRLIGNPPTRFRRSAGMQPLPLPAQGGSIDGLRRFINVRSDSDFVLLIAWLLAAFRAVGPYPLLVLCGEQGSAKSTTSAMLRALVDPHDAPLRALPREDRDLFIAATNGHVLAFDNVSGLPEWTSDTLCRLSTGGSFATRRLYSDQDEVLMHAARPVILNGIEDIVGRPDLADRALFLRLEPIPDERRQPEQELWAAFKAERPRILGALLDAVAVGIEKLPHTRLDKLPRMADFAMWAEACETALWPKGTFSSMYSSNCDDAVQEMVDASPVASAVRTLMAQRTEWRGTASQLLTEFSRVTTNEATKSKEWPRNARTLAGTLRRVATSLRKLGITIEFIRETGRDRTRCICIFSMIQSSKKSRGAQPSGSSAWASSEDLSGRMSATKPWSLPRTSLSAEPAAAKIRRIEIT